MKISKGLKQAYDLQDFTHEAALALRDSLRHRGKLVISREDASAIGSLIKAWESCQERIRIHRNKPMPGAFRPAPPQPRNKRMSPASVGVVCPAPGQPSDPEAAVKAEAPAERTAQAEVPGPHAAVRNGSVHPAKLEIERERPSRA